MDVIALGLGECIATTTNIVGGFQTLHQEHDPLLNFVGELHELRRLVQALQLLDRRSTEVRHGVKLMEDSTQ